MGEYKTNDMKKAIYLIFAVAFIGCDHSELTADEKLQDELDSIQHAMERDTSCISCQIKLVKAGMSKDSAKIKCEKIYY